MKELITIQVSRFLTNELAKQIAQKQWKSANPQSVNRSRQLIFSELNNENDCFEVIAITSNNDLVGRLHCVKNENNPNLWYYGDLFVIPEYRRIGIAKQMMNTAISHLSEMGATTLRCYVEPSNIPSRNLQISLGFIEKPFETFNMFTNDGQIMYETDIPSDLSIIRATIHEAYFVRIMFVQNKTALHAENISLSEWKEILSAEDADEKHFLVYKGALPVAYMKINGLLNSNEAWISMLFVSKIFQHQGIGSFAIKYAEKYAKKRGFEMLKIQTDSDNLNAINCYLKCGYQIYEQKVKVKFCKTL